MKRSKHSLSHYRLFSADMGKIVPIGLTEVLPGDTIQQATSALVRVTPLATPVMHPVNVKIHHWFVPNRIVWDDWESFITGGEDGADTSTFPTIDVSAVSGNGTLADYLGIPAACGEPVNALPFRCYAKIYNEWYRDQDLQTALTIDTTDGTDTTTNTTLQSANWEKDYFTTARSSTQKGADVSLPLGTSADVVSDVSATNTDVEVGNTNVAGNTWKFDIGAGGELDFNTTAAGTPNLYADLTNATAATIGQLREAIAKQRYAEMRMRYGGRYVEYLRSLGIRSSDARLQRPEYLGGGKQTISFSEILQTGVDSSDAGVGTLKGHGIGAMRTNRYRRFFEEHGFVVSLMIVQPKTMYVQGLPKHWSRSTKEDFFQRELQTIGQAAVLNKEIYEAHTTPNGTFGYQDRYDEYRRGISSVHGEFRDASIYQDWHMARIFSSDPALNSTFVTSNPTNRVYQDQTNDPLLIMANHSIQARRMVMKNGTPGGVIL